MTCRVSVVSVSSCRFVLSQCHGMSSQCRVSVVFCHVVSCCLSVLSVSRQSQSQCKCACHVTVGSMSCRIRVASVSHRCASVLCRVSVVSDRVSDVSLSRQAMSSDVTSSQLVSCHLTPCLAFGHVKLTLVVHRYPDYSWVEIGNLRVRLLPSYPPHPPKRPPYPIFDMAKTMKNC